MSAALEWTTERRTVASLKDYDKNPRKFTEKGLSDLKLSMERLGYIDPIAINKDGTIIGGHARRKTMEEMGLTEIDVRVPNRVLTEKEIEEACIRLNKNIAGEFDFDILAGEFNPADLIEWGFTPQELNIPGSAEGLTDPDDAPEAPLTPVNVIGDIWVLGNHRVMCGDSTSIASIEKLTLGDKPEMVLTDPPYGVSIVNLGTKRVGGGGETKFKGKTGKVGGNNVVDARQYAPIIGDETTETARKFYQACLGLGMENYIIFGGNYFTDFLPPRSCWIVWDKENTGNFAAVELAWTSMPTAAKLYKHLWNGLSRKGDRKTELATRVHPTQKPVGLFEQIFTDFQFKKCFDGFLGSGSTLIACEKAGRICYGMEFSAAYCDVIIQRWQNFTGKQAIHAETGRPFNEPVEKPIATNAKGKGNGNLRKKTKAHAS